MINGIWIMFCANFKTMFKTKSFFTVTIMIALAIAAIFNIDRLYQLIFYWYGRCDVAKFNIVTNI
ncbi:hypothetical protein ABFY60_08905 [Lysinibacillus pakistanensis]|uniref:hypothetical protein n=1 Tax=Lysinibacillus pakistanensis TaxID=759811 RepID=UPI003D272366